MPASGMREAHLSALRAKVSGSNHSSRSSSPDPCHVSKEEWMRQQGRLIKEVDPSFDSSLMCPIGISGTSPSALAPQRSSSPASASPTLAGYTGQAGSARPAFALGTGSMAGETFGGGGGQRFESPSRFQQHQAADESIKRVRGSTQSGEFACSSFTERAQGGFGRSGPTRRRSMDATSLNHPVVNFRDAEKASQEMDLEGTFIESMSIIPVDDDKANDSDEVMFSLVPSDGRSSRAPRR